MEYEASLSARLAEQAGTAIGAPLLLSKCSQRMPNHDNLAHLEPSSADDSKRATALMMEALELLDRIPGEYGIAAAYLQMAIDRLSPQISHDPLFFAPH